MSCEPAAIASHLPLLSQFLRASYAKDWEGFLPSLGYVHMPSSPSSEYLLHSLAINMTWPNTMVVSQDIVPAHSLSFGHATGLPERY